MTNINAQRMLNFEEISKEFDGAWPRSTSSSRTGPFILSIERPDSSEKDLILSKT